MSDLKRKIELANELRSQSFDGFARDAAAEERINIACRNVLNSPDGEKVMDYIRSITVNVVLPPEASDGALRMQEGMRRLCGILDARRRSTPQRK